MKYTRFFRFRAVLLFCLMAAGLSAQDPFIVKWHPDLVFTKKIDDQWSASGAISGLYPFVDLHSEAPELPTPERIDGRVILSYKFRNTTISGVYMHRRYSEYYDSEYENRFTQQLKHKAMLGSVRIGHRVLLEQRIFDDGYLNRLRYRLKGEFPLRDREGNERNAYPIVTDELVFAFTGDGQSLENRFELGMGWKYSTDQKLAFKLQHRYKGPDSDQALHVVTNFSYDF